MSRDEALALARPDDGIDLIEISAAAKPPVVRLMSYDKFRYEEEKRIKKERLAQKSAAMKSVQISAKAAHNDLMVKVKQVEKFFARGPSRGSEHAPARPREAQQRLGDGKT